MENKQTINLLDLKQFLQGRKWEDLTEQEQLEISQKIVNLISNQGPS